MNVKKQQLQQLYYLIKKATNTEIGRTHDFESIRTYSAFREQLPVTEYQDIKDTVERQKKGEADIVWPGKVDKFSVSAGTTGSGKHLPLTPDRLYSDRNFIRKVAFEYFKQRPSLSPLLGKHISLPGSLEETSYAGRPIQLGEISGFTGNMTPLPLRSLQVVSPDDLLQLSFSKKFDRIIKASINADIRVITAVPSWILTLFQQVLEKTGKKQIKEVWPNLRLLICGGVKLDNYRDHLKELIGEPAPDFIETYGASEGYFGYSDQLEKKDMRLVTDNGIFYEWIPYKSGSGDPPTRPIPTWKIRPDTPYAMLVTTNSGLWRYAVNDVIEFTTLKPPRLSVKGRVEDVLDHYGEAVYSWEAEKALERSCESFDIGWNCFTLGSILRDAQHQPRHHWFIEFRDSNKIDVAVLKKIAQKVDNHLRRINRHYAIRRSSEALASPVIHLLSRSSKQQWLASRNKIGAQTKMPRIIHAQESFQQLEEITRSAPNSSL